MYLYLPGQLVKQAVGEKSEDTRTRHSTDKSLLYTYNGFSMAIGQFNKDAHLGMLEFDNKKV